MPEESGTQQMQSPTCNIDRNETSIAVDFGGTKTAVAKISRGKIVERGQVATDVHCWRFSW